MGGGNELGGVAVSMTGSATTMRSHRCGELRKAHAGQQVRLGGWVHRRRDLGGLVFIDLRDRDGLVQVAFAPDARDAYAIASQLTSETVVLVGGVVAARPSGQANAELPTGEIEVRGTSVTIVGPAVTPAILVARGKGEALAAEELRLQHRHLDLRRPELQKNLELRHRLLQRSRAVLAEQGFLEIETPILTKPTPEGARDYLVPSRVHPGEFYALPQSPQIYKQLLMVAGFDRYFQLARCFRDEDLRAERQPEFTQIDIEASFIGAEDIYRVTETLLVALWAEAGERVSAPFPRMAHREALERFGTDKPDLRFGLEIQDWTAALRKIEHPFLAPAGSAGSRARGLLAKGGGKLSRKDIDQLADLAKQLGGSGLAWIKRQGDQLSGSIAKALTVDDAARLGLEDGDAALLAVGPDAVTSAVLDRVRRDVIRKLDLAPSTEHAFVWIEQFPMFERDPNTHAWVPVHHPFTAPLEEDRRFLETDPGRVRSTHYDPVYNGVELGSGSIRIVDSKLQEEIFDRMGIEPADAEHRFGFLLAGLKAGAPPHGGIALGFDRIVMALARTESIRDVIAFPKTTTARALFEGAPTTVRQEDLDVLHIKVVK
jgi:aspartyl-tRNA synthetase